MAIKKSELYASLWEGCNALRGGMDASQYKDYVLTLLFVKYISDRYKGKTDGEIEVPDGASFDDLVALKGKAHIGDGINLILGKLADANGLDKMPDFNDEAKLGKGKEMVDRLSKLIAIFQKDELRFGKNRAADDDLLGDAYEYLMRHFATESGKSKGQFYTPAEVSRLMARILDIENAATTSSTTVYDPTCGSGSLLLKVAAAAETEVSLYGQEKDVATASLARMNMVLHNYPTAEIVNGNTLTSPHWGVVDSGLQTFDYVVANPPFSDKAWSTGMDPARDPYRRFDGYGVPPTKQGDYAYLLHIIASLKSGGRGACILPHGVLFRGNAEATIRRNLLDRGHIEGIIGLPANLFYGTGIPACILVLHRAESPRTGIFMIDASRGFIKDGNKNRLRERDLHRIGDVYAARRDVPGFARMVPLSEIEENGFNLNLPRYVDSGTDEEEQDIEGHLSGGIPARELEAFRPTWQACPGLRGSLLRELRPGYLALNVPLNGLRDHITGHPAWRELCDELQAHFEDWRRVQSLALKNLGKSDALHPKHEIESMAEDLLGHYLERPLIDAYAIFQHMAEYADETLLDDLYQIAAEGWKAEPIPVYKEQKGKEKGQKVEKDWYCDLIPKQLVIHRYFKAQHDGIEALRAELETAGARRQTLVEEHGGEDGYFSAFDEKFKSADVKARHKVLQNAGDAEAQEEVVVLADWLASESEEKALRKRIKEAEKDLDTRARDKYAELDEDTIKSLVVDDKWLSSLADRIGGEPDRLCQTLIRRITELAERYATPLPELEQRVIDLRAKVAGHLAKMGYTWN